ncbi:dihydrolipoyl dehydrogenase [Haloplasma contractile]|uniref:Dihydrolipoyl dehydrogenase n=1 Tax=Haloplasma contractile SSD-17B TaxID=1033810 RepID=U2DSN9_9MOLU|nr:dihydrolipoyl dehydrogenase [Haloplasma contractile]ERJ11512.1 dihydrolipoamide dehydrogenase protein [Haloplasma contractile SSD-17B]
MSQYDILILGGGPGGYVAAIKAAQMGAKTALIENKNIGGVCLNWGCIPTKTLLKSAHVYKDIMNAERFGIDVSDKDCVSINWPKMLKRKDSVVNKLTGGVKHLLDKNGVDTFIGHGKVLDKNTILVNDQKIKTKNLILATGSSPKIPPIDGIKDGLDRGQVLTSKQILSLEDIPKELVIIGGGVIGIEFATLFSTLGTDVTIVERASEILVNVDKDIRETMTKILQKDKIKILTDASVKSIDKKGVKIEHDGKDKHLKAEKVLVSIGRSANTEDLEHLGLDEDRHGIVTNEKLETDVDGIYAIGDLNGKYMLAHVASAEGIVAVETIMGKESSIDYGRVPSCIYGFPEIGFVGETEQRAKENGHDVIVSTFPLSANGKALAEGESDGFIKIVADKQYGEVLGVHILAPNATDMIAEAVTTMELEGTVHELASSIHPHPTLSEIVMEAAHGAIDQPIHMYKSKE